MTGYVFQGISTWVFGTSNLTPVLPTYTPGWRAFLMSSISNSGNETATAPAGWTQISPNTNAPRTYVWTKILQPSESNPLVTWSAGGWQGEAAVAVFSGDVYSDDLTLVDVSGDRNSASTTQMPYPGLTPTIAADLILLFSGRQKAAASNGATVAVAGTGSFTKPAGGDSVPNGTQFACTFQYWQQGAATSFGQGSAAYSSTADGSQTSNGVVIAVKSQPSVGLGGLGYIPQPGNPSLSSPSNSLQFGQLSGRPAPSQAPAFAPIQGMAVSTSLVYGAVINSIVNVGFIPQPGPGVSPFNNNQFLTSADGGTSSPSPTTLSLQGISVSASTVYITSSPQVAQAMGIAVSTSTVYGLGTAQTAGSMTGIAVSTSLVYGEIDGLGSMQGLSISQSTASVLGIGGSFQPLVPMTAVVDVRLGVGYQPWKVHPSGTSG